MKLKILNLYIRYNDSILMEMKMIKIIKEKVPKLVILIELPNEIGIVDVYFFINVFFIFFFNF